MRTRKSQTDTSTDVDVDDQNRRFDRDRSDDIVLVSDSNNGSKEKSLDQKTLRRLAQNWEATRKSQLRKKAYEQQLESSRLKLNQLEQEVQQACPHCGSTLTSGDQSHATGALPFDREYARWMEEQNRQINELRAAISSHASDTELQTVVGKVTAHFDEVFKLKGTAAKADVFHILSGMWKTPAADVFHSLSGMWKTPAERCFMWIGGFRSSELLKVAASYSSGGASMSELQQWNNLYREGGSRKK